MCAMTNSQILSHVDHTLLKATATAKEIRQLCDEALEFKTASVCIPPSYVRLCRDLYGSSLNICTVIGFPLGYAVTRAKIAEVETAMADYADEFDMVINFGDVKNGDFASVKTEIFELKQAVGDKILKVIVETCYLTNEEKIALCHAVTESGADYIKTSTGFGTAGAVMDDILLFKNNIGSGVKIKAAGGIRTRDDMIAFINAGCDRLGTSSAVKLLAGEAVSGY